MEPTPFIIIILMVKKRKVLKRINTILNEGFMGVWGCGGMGEMSGAGRLGFKFK